MINNNETVCVVVVTYNRKELLLKCLSSLLNQTYSLDAICIVDNASTDGTFETLKEKGYIGEFINSTNKKVKIHYVKLAENTGGAGGFYEGTKIAYEKMYDWLWLMDDDVEAQDECLFQLISEAKKYSFDTLVLQPLRKNLKDEIINWYPYFSLLTLRCNNISPERSNTICFEGIFISRKIVKEIGFPNKNFFTVLDDTEYGLRISKVAKIRYANQAILIRLNDRITRNDPIKRFFFFRNLFLLSKLHNVPIFWSTLVIFIQVFVSVIKTILFQERKMAVAKLLLKAYLDGLAGRFGKLPNENFLPF